MKNFTLFKSALDRISTLSAAPLTAALFVVILLCAVSAQAQVPWQGPAGNPTSPDYFTNALDWIGGAAPITTQQALLTNGGTILYIADGPTDIPANAWTNIIDQLYIGPSSGANASSGTNTFDMSGGMLTMTDSGGDDWTVGGYSVNSVSNNCIFNMTGGTLNVTNSTGDAYVATGTNATGIANFDGGTANFNNLFLAGRGFATVNIDGGTVNVAPYNAYALTIGEGSSGTLSANGGGYGILNLMAGALNVTNATGNAVVNIGARCNSATLNVSGGTLNASEINWGTGDSGKITNTFNFSGGNVNVGGSGMGMGRGPYVNTNLLVISGGTFSTLPGYNCIETNAINVTLATSPGPGVATFAPLAGTSFTIGSAMKGPGSLDVAGPGQVILSGVSSYTGSTIVSGGELSLTGTGGFEGSPIVIISGGATFDLSAHPLTLATGLTVSNSSSPAIINGSLASGAANAALTYTAGAPSFVISNGILTISNLTVFTVNNLGSALAHGSYLIVSNGGNGSVVGTTPPVTVTGGGFVNTPTGEIAALVTNASGLALVIDAPPVIANSVTNTVSSGSTYQIAISSLESAAGWSDADGDTLTLSSVGPTSVNGTNVTTDGTYIYYDGPVTSSDSFNYVISDGYLTATGTVYLAVSGQPAPTISTATIKANANGNPTFSGIGVDNEVYGVESATNLALPDPWIEAGNVTAAANGSWSFTDVNQTNPPVIFYRLYYPDDPSSPPQ